MEGNWSLTVVFVVGQLQEEVQDVDEGGELVGHLELTAQRDPEVHVSLQRCILHTNEDHTMILTGRLVSFTASSLLMPKLNYKPRRCSFIYFYFYIYCFI